MTQASLPMIQDRPESKTESETAEPQERAKGKGPRFPMPRYPTGWFQIEWSDQLKVGEAKPVQYFGQDLVLFRTESGEVKLLDAYCPHLGAHLGHGGEVEGEELKCPFHAWKFDGEGNCTDTPYAKKIPPKAKLQCWYVREQSGVILAWHDIDKRAPTFEIPPQPEFGDDAWTEPVTRVWHDRDRGTPTWDVPAIDGAGDDDWTPWNHGIVQIKTHPHAIAENVADSGHFIPVHGTHVDEFENIYEAHTATQIAKGVAYPLGGGTDRFQNKATYYGPGFQISEMSGFLESRLLNAHTPIGQNLLDLRFAVLLKKSGDEKLMETYSEKYVENLRQGFFQDVRIWEHKK